MDKQKVLVFASGSAEGGGSGFEKLVLESLGGSLYADIVAVVSNHNGGGVRVRAEKLNIPFLHFDKPWTSEKYQRIALESGASFFALSGWLKLVRGLDPTTQFNSRTVFNIHPGPLPQFGGPGLYGHHVHEAVIASYKRGEIGYSAVSMHFVTEQYDRGPTFFRCFVKINDNDTPESLGERINRLEHLYQPRITNMVVNGLIKWNGFDPNTLWTPLGHSMDCYDHG